MKIPKLYTNTFWPNILLLPIIFATTQSHYVKNLARIYDMYMSEDYYQRRVQLRLEKLAATLWNIVKQSVTLFLPTHEASFHVSTNYVFVFILGVLFIHVVKSRNLNHLNTARGTQSSLWSFGKLHIYMQLNWTPFMSHSNRYSRYSPMPL